MRTVLRLILWTLFIAAAIIGMARATAIRWWRIPPEDLWLGASVAPTLQPGDWVILWRLTRPTEGDLVRCPEPKAPERVVVGRILGTGNDHIEVDKGLVKLNGRTLPTERGCPAFDVLDPRAGYPIRQSCRVEDLGGRLYMRGGLTPDARPPPSMSAVTVEHGQFFLVSDNRQFSFDSRDYGTVEAKYCKETVIFRLWSKNGFFEPMGRFDLVH